MANGNSMTNEELYENHRAGGMSDQEAAVLVDSALEWPRKLNIYDCDEPAEWVRPRLRIRGGLCLEEYVHQLEHKLEGLRAELKKMRGEE